MTNDIYLYPCLNKYKYWMEKGKLNRGLKLY